MALPWRGRVRRVARFRRHAVSGYLITADSLGDRPPRSPEERERPRVASPGGVLFLAFAEDAHASNGLHSIRQGNPGFPPWSIRVARLRARGRGAAATGACALRGDAPTRAAFGWNNEIGCHAPTRIAGWRQPAMRNILEHVSAARAFVPSGARGAAVAYAEAWNRVFRNDDGRVVRHRRRRRLHRFDSGTSPLDSSVG